MTFSLFLRIFLFVMLVVSVIAGRAVVIWGVQFATREDARRYLRLSLTTLLVILNLPGVYMLIFGVRSGGGFTPGWQIVMLYPYLAWQVSAVVLTSVLTVKTLIGLPYMVYRWLKARRTGRLDVDLQRRAFLAQAATILPASLLISTGYGIYNAQSSFDWQEPEFRLKDWPTALHGLRVMQISDLHIGTFLNGRDLKGHIEEINRRECDIMVITGDIIDRNMAYFPECMEAMSKLRIPKYGSYVCIGNHDYYSGGAEEILQGMTRLGMTVVRDNHVTVPVRGTPLTIAGIDYPMRAGIGRNLNWFSDHVDRALAHRPADVPTILLAHHPHAFDQAALRGVPLTLAGHTHGGQFAFSYPGGSISLGDLMFKYVAGPYAKDESALYVNRGLGNWFPMRLGAPPEVSLITLL
jgi:predicted MPP superfamily phosphohydrolase